MFYYLCIGYPETLANTPPTDDNAILMSRGVQTLGPTQSIKRLVDPPTKQGSNSPKAFTTKKTSQHAEQLLNQKARNGMIVHHTPRRRQQRSQTEQLFLSHTERLFGSHTEELFGDGAPLAEDEPNLFEEEKISGSPMSERLVDALTLPSHSSREARNARARARGAVQPIGTEMHDPKNKSSTESALKKPTKKKSNRSSCAAQ